MSTSTPTPKSKLLFLLLLIIISTSNLPSSTHAASGSEEEAAAEATPAMTPKPAAGFTSMVLNETRRRLGSFQLCAPCTCCGGPKGACLLSPCCYSINCNIPNKPFGFCSFTPRACDCLRCSL